MTNADINWIANYIWGICDDVLRNLNTRSKYRDVVLPMTVLRRLDIVLEGTKQAVLDMKDLLDGAGVVDQEGSPDLLVAEMDAHYLFAIAENDDMEDPEAKNLLRETFDAAGLPAEIEVYEGALHGWCPPDSAVYIEAQAERAWSRLLVLFGTALA